MKTLSVIALFSLYLTKSLHAQAPAPPMGWNSWDAYGLTVNEAEYKANAKWLADNLKSYGWRYAVVDEGWYLVNPLVKPSESQFVISPDGRYQPAKARYPSGFKGLSDYAHSLGLQFGIHIIRGIPKEAVAKNLPIEGSSFHAVDAADQSDTCPWNVYNYGVKDTPAGQAYYDSLARLYAGWGVDFLKVDCISSHPYKGDEIRMISLAIHKTGRPMVLSLSPGPTPLEHASEVVKYSQMWRISDDVWDHWSHDPKMDFSQSISGQFAVAASWAKWAGPNHWPDADMLPIGFLGPRPGEGAARMTRLTHDEQQTLMTAWCIFRSPLIVGANLTKMDDWTKALITNAEVIAVNQHSSGERQVSREADRVIWEAKADGGKGTYVAVFNLSDHADMIAYPARTGQPVRDLWGRRDVEANAVVKVRLPAHGSALYLVK